MARYGDDEPFALYEHELPPRRPRRHPMWAAVTRGLQIGLLTLLLLVCIAIAGVVVVYAYYARTLPLPGELYARAAPFQSTRILDRHGTLLYEVFDPSGGRRTLVRYEQLPPHLVAAVVATEDATFFTNPGLNPLAIARALYQDLQAGGVVSGASTITQQLVKNLYLSPERTVQRKVQEAILAAELTRRYSKEEILTIYLNEVYFGNLAYGVGAAAEAYFGKPVEELDLGEAALLVGLIQSPAAHDPYTNPDGALARRRTVLRLMHQRGYITAAERDAAADQPLVLMPQRVVMRAPHMVVHVREQLERQLGTEMLYKGGLNVYTTLDLQMQQLAEEVLREQAPAIREGGAGNAALVAIDPWTGDVLAMAGSVDFWDTTIDGQVNVVLSPRQPGSTLKPFTYLAAMERGATPATMLMDVAQDFPDGANPPYRPANYDGQEWGPISLRTALGSSRNIPAVAVLHDIGLPALQEMAQRLGITSLDKPYFGLSLTLGGGEVTLMELAGAYGALANTGHRVAPRTVLRVVDSQGQTVIADEPPLLERVIDERLAYLITHILADDEARRPAFGADSPMRLSFPAAAKTGTTNDFRDAWIVGYTPELVTGVWVGNNDNTPTNRLSGSRGAGPIWHDFMERALAGRPHADFTRPEGLVEREVCPISGQPRGEDCPPGRAELFLAETILEESCPVHRRVHVCRESGQLATVYCPLEDVEEVLVEDYGARWDAWALAQGKTVPPRDECPLHVGPVRVSLAPPPDPLSGVAEIRGSADAPGFEAYYVELGAGHNPQEWRRLTPEITAPVIDGVLLRWDTRTWPNGPYVLRLVVRASEGRRHEARVAVELGNATPTPTATLSPTPTLTPTATPEATPTPEPSPTMAAPTPTATLTPPPTATAPAPSPTATPVAPTPTIEPSPSPTATQPIPTATPTETATPKPPENGANGVETASGESAPPASGSGGLQGYPAP